VVSLALLVLGVVLAVALVGIVGASVVEVLRGPDLAGLCSNRYGCPPSGSIKLVPGAIAFTELALGYGADSFWLKRVEATSGVRFRYPTLALRKPLCYIRQPGVTPDAATTALVRVSLVRAGPKAREVFSHALVTSLFTVPLCAIYLLNAWLPGQWLPG
jgi:hypothetical protein